MRVKTALMQKVVDWALV